MRTSTYGKCHEEGGSAYAKAGSYPMDCSPPSSLSMEFSKQEYWSGLPCPPPGHLPNPEIESRSPTLQVDSLPPEPPGKPLQFCNYPKYAISF